MTEIKTFEQIEAALKNVGAVLVSNEKESGSKYHANVLLYNQNGVQFYIPLRYSTDSDTGLPDPTAFIRAFREQVLSFDMDNYAVLLWSDSKAYAKNRNDGASMRLSEALAHSEAVAKRFYLLYRDLCVDSKIKNLDWAGITADAFDTGTSTSVTS